VRAAASSDSKERGELAQPALLDPVSDERNICSQAAAEVSFTRSREKQCLKAALSCAVSELAVALFGPRARVGRAREVNEQEGAIAWHVESERLLSSAELSRAYGGVRARGVPTREVASDGGDAIAAVRAIGQGGALRGEVAG
jgi:hypothetical protein